MPSSAAGRSDSKTQPVGSDEIRCVAGPRRRDDGCEDDSDGSDLFIVYTCAQRIVHTMTPLPGRVGTA
jgi:hypothetical protein